MARTKQKRSRKPAIAAPVIGAVGASMALAGAADATGTPAPDPSLRNSVLGPQINLSEEEIADVSLGTFFVFDREDLEGMGQQYAQRRCGGCGRCAGVARCAGARCAGVARCAGGCRCGGCRGCRGCAIGGCRACIACAGCSGCSCGCCVSWGACQYICT
jgi:hypothetical protein